MRNPAQAALFLLHIALGRCVPTTSEPSAQLNCIPDTHGHVAALLCRIPCLECRAGPDSDLSLLLELELNESCDGPGVLLNEHEQSHSWNRILGHRSGWIATRGNDIEGDEIFSESHIVCDPCSFNRPDEGTIWLLTGNMSPGGAAEAGFAVSLPRIEKLKVPRVTNQPLENIDNASVFDESRAAGEIECDSGDQPTAEMEQDSEELQALQAELQRLIDCINRAEHISIRRLKAECSSLQAKRVQCESVTCKVKVVLQVITGFLRKIRFKCGQLMSLYEDLDREQYHYLASPIHLRRYRHSVVRNASLPKTVSKENPFNPSITAVSPSDTFRALSNHNYYNRLLVSCVIILLILALGAYVFKVCRNASRHLRKRAEAAARREERRLHRAYRNAARRLRWKQWWESRSYQSIPRPPSSHRLSELESLPLEEEHAQLQDSDPEANYQRPQRGSLHAEILGMERVLAFVGQLVRSGHKKDLDTDKPPQYSEREPLVHSSYPIVGSAPSSSAVLSASNSPRTSSLLTCDDTTSLLTFDTLESVDAAPPSYHE